MPASHPGTMVPVLGLLLAVWAALPPYVGSFGRLPVSARVEVADHVLPGLVVLLVSLVGYLLLRRSAGPEPMLLVAGGIVTLAGFWMVATHLGLIGQAQDGMAPWGAVAWHATPGVAVSILGVTWMVRF